MRRQRAGYCGSEKINLPARLPAEMARIDAVSLNWGTPHGGRAVGTGWFVCVWEQVGQGWR